MEKEMENEMRSWQHLHQQKRTQHRALLLLENRVSTSQHEIEPNLWGGGTLMT